VPYFQNYGTFNNMKKLFLILLFIPHVSFAGWFHQSSGTTHDLYSVNFNHGNENIAWACGENGAILYTSNGGVNWIIQNSGTANNLRSIVFMEIQGGPVFAVGDGGLILRTTNNGSNWLPVPSPVTSDLYDISDFGFIAVGDSGTILKSSDSGLNWKIIPYPTTKNLYSVSGSFGVCIVGEDGFALGGAASVQTWTTLNTGITSDLLGLPLFGARDLAVGKNGIILRSMNSGINWHIQNSLTSVNLNSVEYSVNNTSRIYAVGDSGVILKTMNSGVNWGFQQSNTTENLNSTFFYLDDNTGYAVGNNGTILKTTDGGGVITSLNNEVSILPDEFKLLQNFPNPFNPTTKIKFSLPLKSTVTLRVFDISGKEVSVLVNGVLALGSHEVKFDAKDLSSGIYFYTLKAGEISLTKKMILMK
jgi:photosystem II stability/assembly factor-like uncharacterized protein